MKAERDYFDPVSRSMLASRSRESMIEVFSFICFHPTLVACRVKSREDDGIWDRLGGAGAPLPKRQSKPQPAEEDQQ